MVLENKYLRKAIQKAGYVIIVKTCHINERKSQLEYVSPNATMLGMNIEMLNKGMKLSEDYIHPQDREKVIKTVLEAVQNNVEDYTHEYRMVGDDGKLYYVSNEISVSDVTDGFFKVEFYIKDITDSRAGEKVTADAEKRVARTFKRTQQNAVNISKEKIDDLITDDKVKLMMETFTKLTGLYSVFVDVEGRIVFPPTGPATNLGDFYDLFEKPAYKEYYKHIKQTVLENDAPTILDREEGGIGKISAVPIKIGDELKGIWMVGSYTKEETEKLRTVYDSHWEIANMISEDLRMTIAIDIESTKSKGAGKKLLDELTRQSIVSDAMSKINSKLIDTADQVIEETLRNVGINMGIDKAGLYTIDNSTKNYVLRSYWDASGEVPGKNLLSTLPDNMYMVEKLIRDGDGSYVADNANQTEANKLLFMKYGVKAVIAYPIELGDKLYGILFLAESSAERVWTSDELRFTYNIAVVIQNMLENAVGDDNIRNVNKHLIETYNNFNVAIFVRDAHSGEVLFSNKKMNELMGGDFTGHDSRELITDLRDKFDNLDGVRKPFITKERVVNWRRYIQRLDNIMDITEISIEWLSGEAASLIILRKAKDL
ncbi:MAG: GAF domain-containing protein [Lachnospiraceae bacterium]|nr:GAF domain-containing protein [Lachnospiraceae bacterium]